MYFNVIGPDLREYELIDAATLRRWVRQRRLDLASPAKEFGDTGWRTVGDFPSSLEEPPPPVPEAAGPPPVPGTPPELRMVDGIPVIPPMEFDRPPPSYLLASVLASLFLLSCFPAGLFALWFSLAVGRRWRAGDREGAERASFWARAWCLLTLCVGFPIALLAWWLSAKLGGLL